MPSHSEPATGQPVLPGFEFPAGSGPGAGEAELAAVAAELGALDRDGTLMAAAIRGALGSTMTKSPSLMQSPVTSKATT